MSKNKRSLKTPFYIVFLITIGMYIGKYLVGNPEYIYINNGERLPKLVELLSYVEHNYVDAIDLDSLQEEVIAHTLESLDPHSNYIPVEELQEITESMEGNFDGIGVEFQIMEDTIVVVSPISGGPSQRKGIRSGDRIVQVDTLNVAGVGFTNKDVVSTLRGPKGTSVKLYIKRKHIDRLLEFTIVRDKIPITSVDVAYMINSEVGYIKVNRFSGTTEKEFVQALDGLKAKGMNALVLDLRSNPGGFLSAAIAMVDEFLSSGELVVYTQGNSRDKQVYTSSYYGGFKKGELVVLVDEGSASASEIVAGAIQDHDRGAVIGRRTFGKGLVQEQSQMGDGSAFRLTTARYYTPSGRSIQKPYSKDVEAYHQEAYLRYESGELYNEDSLKVADSLKFYTSGGRVVYGGGGITPDYFIPLDTLGRSNWLYDVIAENIVNTFVFNYIDAHRKDLAKYTSAAAFNQEFEVTESIFQDFVNLSEEKGIEPRESEILQSKEWISLRLKAQISRQEWDDEGFFRAVNDKDSMLKKAMQLLENK